MLWKVLSIRFYCGDRIDIMVSPHLLCVCVCVCGKGNIHFRQSAFDAVICCFFYLLTLIGPDVVVRGFLCSALSLSLSRSSSIFLEMQTSNNMNRLNDANQWSSNEKKNLTRILTCIHKTSERVSTKRHWFYVYIGEFIVTIESENNWKHLKEQQRFRLTTLCCSTKYCRLSSRFNRQTFNRIKLMERNSFKIYAMSDDPLSRSKCLRADFVVSSCSDRFDVRSKKFESISWRMCAANVFFDMLVSNRTTDHAINTFANQQKCRNELFMNSVIICCIS